MPNIYPDSIIVLAEMIPDVRIALIQRIDSLKDSASDYLSRGLFDSAISEIEHVKMISAFVCEIDSKIQFDEEEEAPF